MNRTNKKKIKNKKSLVGGVAGLMVGLVSSSDVLGVVAGLVVGETDVWGRSAGLSLSIETDFLSDDEVFPMAFLDIKWAFV